MIKLLKFWDVNDGCLRTLKAHDGWVNCIIPESNGVVLLSGSEDKTMKIWNMETGECVRELVAQFNDAVRFVLVVGNSVYCVGNSAIQRYRMLFY